MLYCSLVVFLSVCGELHHSFFKDAVDPNGQSYQRIIPPRMVDLTVVISLLLCFAAKAT